MTIEQAKKIIPHAEEWSLRNMIKALSFSVSSFLNTEDDNRRLQAAKILLREINKEKKRNKR
jgi:hypothetical protein